MTVELMQLLHIDLSLPYILRLNSESNRIMDIG